MLFHAPFARRRWSFGSVAPPRAAVPTPPPAPLISNVSPEESPAWTLSASKAVTNASGAAADPASLSPGSPGFIGGPPGAFGAGAGFGVNQPADAGPQTRANAAIRKMRAIMEELDAIRTFRRNLSRRRSQVHVTATRGCYEPSHCHFAATKKKSSFRRARRSISGSTGLQRPNPLLYPFQFPLTCVRSQE